MPEGPKEQSKEPEIRTMRDDLLQAKQTTKPVTPAQPVFRSPIPPPDSRFSQTPKASPANPVPVSSPLQPKLNMKAAPVGEKGKHKRDVVLLSLIVLFVVSALAAAGVWAWIFWGDSLDTQENTVLEDNTPKAFVEVIPANSLLVAHYTITTPEERTSLREAWQTPEEPTMVATVGGNPTLLLEQSAISEFAYVLLPGDPRLYLVIQASDEVDQFLAKYSNIQVLEVANWRVVHSFATATYEQQLVSTSRGATGKVANRLNSSLTLHVSRELLQEIHDASGVVLGGADELTLGITFKEEEGNRIAYFQNGQNVPLPPEVAIDSIGLLATIPGDAIVVRLGPSFTEESFRLHNPAALQRLEEFSGPYAYFERTGDDGAKDVGVVTVVPDDVVATLLLPDVAIEAAIAGLHQVAGLGEAPGAELAFVDSTYKEIPLRYVNLDGPALALDYAFLNNVVALASSKEGMYRLIDTARGQAASAAAGPWATLDQALSGYGGQKAFGSLTQPAIKRLLPGAETVTSLSFGFAFTGSEAPVVAGAILLEEPAP